MLSWPAPHVPLIPAHGPTLRLYDADLGRAETTGGPGPAGIYVCGAEAAGGTSLGRVAAVIAVDLLVRTWRDAGLAVTHVGRVTDDVSPRPADDGVRAAAQEDAARVALVMTDLGVLPPDHCIDDDEAVPLVVEAVEGLIERGEAERSASGDVLLRGGPLLWRSAPADEPAWPGGSLGPGRPGPDVTCAVVAARYLGAGLDVLAGGPEVPAGHQAAVEAILGVLAAQEKPVQRRVRAGRAGLPGAAVETGAVADLLGRGIEPMAVRLLILAHHYRADWDLAPAELDAAQERLARWIAAVSGNGGPAAEDALAEIRAALADDLDAPRALRAIDIWADRALSYGQPGGLEDADMIEGAPGVIARAADALLGIRL